MRREDPWGTACLCSANKSNGRCKLHVGARPRTADGGACISAVNLRHEKFAKDKLEKRSARAAKGREIRKELLQMERGAPPGGSQILNS